MTIPRGAVSDFDRDEELVALTHDMAFSVRDVSTGAVVFQGADNALRACCARWSPDGQHLAVRYVGRVTGHFGMSLRPPKASGRTVLRVPHGVIPTDQPEESVSAVVQVWSRSGSQVVQPVRLSVMLTSMSWTAPSVLLLAGMNILFPISIDVDRGWLETLRGHESKIDAVAGEGRRFAVSDVGGRTSIWARHRSGPLGGGSLRRWGPTGDVLWEARVDGVVGLRDAASGRWLARTRVPAAVAALCPGPDGSLLVGDQAGTVWRWRPSSDPSVLVRLASLADLSWSETRQVLLARLTDGALITRLPDARLLRIRDAGAMAAPMWSSDGMTSAYVVRDEVRLLRLGHPPVRLKLGSIAAFRWHPQDGRFVVAHGDARISVYSTEGLFERKGGRVEPRMQVTVPDIDIRRLAWKPDGSQFIAVPRVSVRLRGAAAPRWARVWTADGQYVDEADDGMPFWDAAWSPDGRWLVLTTIDGRVHLYDGSSLQAVTSFRGHTQSKTAVSWSATGQWFMTQAEDGSSMNWPAPTRLKAVIDALPARSLTQAERERWLTPGGGAQASLTASQ